jgi:hypothetical protein
MARGCSEKTRRTSPKGLMGGFDLEYGEKERVDELILMTIKMTKRTTKGDDYFCRRDLLYFRVN